MLKRLFFGFLICSALGTLGVIPSVAAQDGTPSPVASGPTPVIIDSDMISDDWMATLFVLNDPRFDVRAITVTGNGFATCDAGVAAALGLLALTDYDDVPVACGAETPLVGNNAVPADWRTTLEMVQALGLPSGGQASEQDAVTLLTEHHSAIRPNRSRSWRSVR